MGVAGENAGEEPPAGGHGGSDRGSAAGGEAGDPGLRSRLGRSLALG